MIDEPADVELLVRYWRAHDALFAGIEPTWWGAVVRDARYPAVYEMNYARVEARDPVDLAEVEGALLVEGPDRPHVVTFRPEDQMRLVIDASTRGNRSVWDLVMAHDGRGDRSDPRIQEAALDDAFWTVYDRSLGWFGVPEPETARQLRDAEREVLVPGGRRWFAGWQNDQIVALGGLLVLEGIGYVDHVATDPNARRRGFATALTRRIVAEAKADGAERTYLLAEPGSPGAVVYERIGFEAVWHIASWTSAAR